jgi:hypothetical protein
MWTRIAAAARQAREWVAWRVRKRRFHKRDPFLYK